MVASRLRIIKQQQYVEILDHLKIRQQFSRLHEVQLRDHLGPLAPILMPHDDWNHGRECNGQTCGGPP
jgi:hypothetical protein